MEKQIDNTLMKARSYRSILAEGYRLYNENFRKLFKASWLMAIIYALCCGAFGTLTSIKLPELTVVLIHQLTAAQDIHSDTAQQYVISMTCITALLILAIATMSLATATILNKLKEHKETGTISAPPSWLKTSPNMMVRSLKGSFLTLLILLIPLLLFIGLIAVADGMKPQFVMHHLTTVSVTFFICSIIVALLSPSLFYVLMKYLMEAPCGYWKTLTNNYGRGMRHWGSLFLVFFVSFLLISLIGFVVMLPAYILNYANQLAHQGLLIGDPLGMPTYMTALTFATFALCNFIQFYVSQVMLVHNYYIYGSIETQETEREQQKQDIR